MDQFNVLDITNDIESLERDMNDWSLLTYDQRKRANEECVNKYGCTNQQLYNMLKAKILGNEGNNETLFTLENFIIRGRQALIEATLNIDFDKEKYPSGYTNNGEINSNIDKIKKAKEIISQEDDDIVIINDFIDDNHMDYGLDELENKYQKHVRNIYDHKIRSDYYSKEIWGRDVDSMYMYMKNKILSMTNPLDKDIEIELSDTDKELNNYKLDLQKEEEENKRVNLLKRKLYNKLYKNELSLYEQTVLEGYFDNIKVKGQTYRQGMPGIVPFLTYDEYVNNPKCLDQKKICNFDPFTYVLNYKDYSHKIKDEILEAYENNDIDTLLGLGWNPVVKPTNENFVYARERQIKWMDEHCAIEIDDLTDFYTEMSNKDLMRHIEEASEMKGAGLGPVYILVSRGELDSSVTNTTINATNIGLKYGSWSLTRGKLNYNNKWGFPGIAFEPSLNNIYSIDPATISEISNGDSRMYKINRENLKEYSTNIYRKNSDIGVFVIFVPVDIRIKMKKAVDNYYASQGGSIRSIKNASDIIKDSYKIKSPNVSYIIGTFLNSIFLISDIDLKYVNDRYTKAVSVDYDNSNKPHAIMLFYGKHINYNKARIESNTNALLAFNDYMDLTLFKKGLDLDKKTNNLRAKLLPSLEGALIKTDDPEANDIIREIREICRAHDFTESTFNYYTEDYYQNRINNINNQLSECGYSDIDKIQHLINELGNIRITLINNRDKLSSDDLLNSIFTIYYKYENLL